MAMATRRKSLPVDVRRQVLHEAGYMCANPICRRVLTLDIHHIVPLSENGPYTVDNLLALCPNCHAMHHRGRIPQHSLLAWKMHLVSLNTGYEPKSIQMLLTLGKVGELFVSGDGVLACAALIALDLVRMERRKSTHEYSIALTEKGRAQIEVWKESSQRLVFSSYAISN